MPKLGLGSPNASRYPNMRPEPINYNEFSDEDDVSTTAAVNGADCDFNEAKKRAAAEDKNPGATKKSKADGEDEQIPAAALPPPRVNLILNMKEDARFRKIMNEAIENMIGVEYNAVVEKEVGTSIMEKLKRKYHLLDTNGAPADDVIALHKISTCLRNKLNYQMRKSDEQSQPSRLLPKIFLSMPKDQNYKKIITEAFNRFDGEEYGGTVEEMGIEVLQSLKQKYLVVDKNGKPIDDEAARQTLIQCLRNQHYRRYRSPPPSPPPAVTTVSTLDSLTAGSNVKLDMRVDKTYKETLNKFFNDYVNKEYADELETGNAILQKLQRRLGTEGKFLKRAGNGFVEVDREAALEMILQRLAEKSQNQTLPRHQNRTQDSGRVQSQSQEVGPRVQTLTRDNLSEAERVGLLEFFGRSIVVDRLRNSDSCEFKFHVKRGLTEQWIAVKKGTEKKDAEEDVTMLTGLRKIANWAFREGHFEAYAKGDYGRNMLERKGLSAESYKIIFDEDQESSGSGAVSRRTVSPHPHSSHRENADRGSTMRFQLRGEELSDYMEVYTDVVVKRNSASDENGKQFFGLLQKCLQTKMVNTQQWNAKKDILADEMKRFEVAVEKAAAINHAEAINRTTNNSWFEDVVIPSIIEGAKEKLLDA
mmetsp:Transcript_8423/g.13903  ORF Transcript_8423/g.13903 Transcript_8423/m.13903 type:complete len:646 (+) Transcript_8423:137-2074(+)